MAKAKRKRTVQSFPILIAHAAGIDIHADQHWVAVAPGSTPDDPDQSDEFSPEVRKFGACTSDLEAIADWLKLCGVTSVAMESTGVYWIPLFELLEQRGFEVLLVDPRQTRQVTGRPKSDRLDCQWIRRLHSCGLLAGSFRPADDIVVLQVHHIQKALEEMNVKLTEAVSDVVGLTGMAIIEAILSGERDAKKLAALRHANCKRTESEIAKALKGVWRKEHLFALKQAVEVYEKYQKLLTDCDRQIEECLMSFADKSGGVSLPAKPARKGRKANDLRFDARKLLHRMSGTDLTIVEGIDANTALALTSEIGLEVSKFPSAKHFTSWLPSRRSQR